MKYVRRVVESKTLIEKKIKSLAGCLLCRLIFRSHLNFFDSRFVFVRLFKLRHSQKNRRDCFCDSSCIQFGDCCQDHAETCAHLHPETTTEGTTNSTPTSKPGITPTSPQVSSCDYIQERDKIKLFKAL